MKIKRNSTNILLQKILKKAKIAEKKGDFRCALSLYKRYLRIKNIVLERENSLFTAQLEEKYDAKKRYTEAELFKEKNEKLTELNRELEETLRNIETLRGLIPVCPKCKKVRTDEGFWQKVEYFVESHIDASFTHSLCQDCAEKFYKKTLKQSADRKKDEENQK